MPMSKQEAQTIATSRERGKSKHLSHMRWVAKHCSIKGWHPALIASHKEGGK